MLNTSGISGHPCGIPDLKDFNLAPLSMMLAEGFSIVRKFLYSPSVLSVFFLFVFAFFFFLS